jgi:hypothetical protein
MPKYAQTYLKKMQDADPGNIAFKNEPYVSKIRFEPTIATDGSNNVRSRSSRARRRRRSRMAWAAS